jgi:hypothetical protein
MIDPFRLKQSGGIAQRLLDSAGIDQPSQAARRRAEMLAGTASSFSSTRPEQRPRASGSHSFKTLLTWIVIGGAASLALAPLVVWVTEHGSVAASALVDRPPAGAEGIEAEPKQVATSGAPSDEARRLEIVVAALRRGDSAGALAALDAYDAAHPVGQLRTEANALRVQARLPRAKTTSPLTGR